MMKERVNRAAFWGMGSVRAWEKRCLNTICRCCGANTPSLISNNKLLNRCYLRHTAAKENKW